MFNSTNRKEETEAIIHCNLRACNYSFWEP